MIQQIQIENIRNFEHAATKLGPATMITGWNGAGKSTVLNAIRLVLFGKWPGVTKQSDLIRAGAKSGRIGIDMKGIDGTVYVELDIRGSKSEFSVKDRNGDVLTTSRKELWKHVEASRVEAEIACFAQENLHGQGLSDALLTLSGNIGLKQLTEYVEKHPVADVMDLVAMFGHLDKREDSKHAEVLKAGDALTADEWTAIGNAAYTYRTELNRRQKDILTLLKGAPTVEPDGAGTVETDLAKEREALAKWMKALAEIQAWRQVAGQHDVEAIKAKVADLEARMVTHERELEGAKADAESLRAELNNAKDARDKFFFERKQVEQSHKVLAAQLSDIESRETCPTCNRDWLPDEESVAKLQAEVDAWQEKIDGAHDESQRLSEAVESAEKAYKAARVDVDSIEEECAKLRGSHAQAITERVMAEKAAALTEPLQTEEQVTRHLDEVNERIQQLETVKADLKRWSDTEALRTEHRKSAQRLTMLDWACEHLRKGQFQSWCLREPLKGFLDVLNAVADPFGYLIGYLHDGGIVLTIQSERNPRPVPLADASRGEQTIAAMALAIGFSKQGGRMGMVDNADALDGSVKGEVMTMLKAYADSGVIVCGAYGAPAEPVLEDVAAIAAPVRFIFMASGEIESAQVSGPAEAVA